MLFFIGFFLSFVRFFFSLQDMCTVQYIKVTLEDHRLVNYEYIVLLIIVVARRRSCNPGAELDTAHARQYGHWYYSRYCILSYNPSSYSFRASATYTRSRSRFDSRSLLFPSASSYPSFFPNSWRPPFSRCPRHLPRHSRPRCSCYSHIQQRIHYNPAIGPISSVC